MSASGQFPTVRYGVPLGSPPAGHMVAGCRGVILRCTPLSPRAAGWKTPHPPCPGADPRGRLTPQNRPKKGSNFGGFFDPCGATPWGGGGAPPTTLILLRNQS